MLEVGCGTGTSLVPMLDRGWRVTGCDVSPGMVAVARAKIGASARLLVADMRELPQLGTFDLVWSLNDALNYLHSREELDAALVGMRRNLAETGVLLFDLNTLANYRSFFSTEFMVEGKGRRLLWEGQMSPDEVAPGVLATVRYEAVGEAGSEHVHLQRHFPQEEVLGAIEGAGLRCVALLGELNGELHEGVDEEEHTKSIYVCRLAKTRQSRRPDLNRGPHHYE
ncbi:MAG: class I SAM-dependent DNA methyltransferase [Solirubrobacterales bacterium]